MHIVLCCIAVFLVLAVVLALPLAAAHMRKHTPYNSTPVLRTVHGRTILPPERAPSYASITPLDEPDCWRVDISMPCGKQHRFFIGPDDVIAPTAAARAGTHSAPWQSHDRHYPNFGISIGVMAGTRLETVLLYEDAHGTPVKVDFLLLFSAQIRVSYLL